MMTVFKNISDSIKPEKRAAVKKAAQIGIFFLLVGFMSHILYTLFTTDRGILYSLTAFKPHYLILATGFALVPWFTNTFRVMIWTRFLGHRFSFVHLLKITISTDLGSALSPTAIGGGYVKAGMLMHKGLSPGASASLMTLGSVEDGLFFLITIPILIYGSKCWNQPIIQRIVSIFEQNLIKGIVFILFVVLLVLIVRFWRRKTRGTSFIGGRSRFYIMLKKVFRDFIAVYKLIGKAGKSRFAVSMVLTSIQWACRYSILTALLLSFGIPADPVLISLFQWITFTLMTFIPTPGATLGAEASFYFIYTTFIPKEFLGIMMTGWRFLTFYLNIILGVLVIGAFLIADFRKSNL